MIPMLVATAMAQDFEVGLGARRDLLDSSPIGGVELAVARSWGLFQLQGWTSMAVHGDEPPALQRTLAVILDMGPGGRSPVDWQHDLGTVGAAAVLALGPDCGPRALLIGGADVRWVETRSVTFASGRWRVGLPRHSVAAGPVVGAGMGVDPTPWSDLRLSVVERLVVTGPALRSDPTLSLDLLVRPGVRR